MNSEQRTLSFFTVCRCTIANPNTKFPKIDYLSKKNNDMKRAKAIDTVKELPKEFDLDILLERLVFIEKVEQGLMQVKQKKVTAHSKVKEIAKKW
jgi:hypothetical protein